MKKFISVLSLVLVAAMLCVSLVSCGAKPADNPDDAVAALKANGYTAQKVDDYVYGEKDGEFVMIYYCENEDDAKEMFEEAEEELKDMEEELANAKKELDDAKAELEEVKDDPIQKAIAELAVQVAEKALEMVEKYEDCEIGQSGNVVWVGTSQAIKDAK